MKIFLTICAFINSWLGTHLGRPTRHFRRREYFKGMMYHQDYIKRLNQHLLFHGYLSKLDQSDSWAKYEHDVSVTNILNDHALARAAWYNDRVFKYIDKTINEDTHNTLSFYNASGYFNYPLYQITTTNNIENFLKASQFTDECVYHDISIRRALLRDNKEWPLPEHLLMKNHAAASEYELNTLDSMLADRMLRRLALTLTRKSIEQNRNPAVSLQTVKNIRFMLELICFMEGVVIKEELREHLVDKLRMCDLHSVGVTRNEDNPTKRCLDMLAYNNSCVVPLITYLVKDKHSYEIGGALSDLLDSGTFVHPVFNPSALLGNAQYILPLGECYQWFQFFDFKREVKRPRPSLKDDGVVYIDDITDFRSLLMGTTQLVTSNL